MKIKLEHIKLNELDEFVGILKRNNFKIKDGQNILFADGKETTCVLILDIPKTKILEG